MKYRRDRNKGIDRQADIIRHKREKEREQCVSERERKRDRGRNK